MIAYRQLAVQAPFEEIDHSGFRRKKGAAALNEYLSYNNVAIEVSDRDLAPFTVKT